MGKSAVLLVLIFQVLLAQKLITVPKQHVLEWHVPNSSSSFLPSLLSLSLSPDTHTTYTHTSTKTQSLPLIAWPMHTKYYPFLTFGSRTNTVTLFSITSTAGKEAFHTSVRGSILLWNQEEQDNGAWDRDEP